MNRLIAFLLSLFGRERHIACQSHKPCRDTKARIHKANRKAQRDSRRANRRH